MCMYQYRAMKIAKQLCYGEEVIEKIRNAKDEHEVTRILYDARNKEVRK